jgi:hypothetical protein
LAGIPADIADGDDIDDADNDPTNEIETWSTLAGIPADIADGDDVDDADNDPTNEIELPAGGQEGQVLKIIGGVPTWTDSECDFYIGELHEGGIIFYLDATGCHGLIAATSDQSSGCSWGCLGLSILGTNAGVNSSDYNTYQIVDLCPSVGTAADICRDLILSGYNDWVLPSKDALALMYINLHQAGLGNFSSDSYHSSTEYDATYMWFQDFSNGNVLTWKDKTNPTNRVRAIRAF